MGFNVGDLASVDKLKNVWDNMREKNWAGLLDSIQNTKEEKGSDQTLDKFETNAKRCQEEGQEFPRNLTGLAGLLNR